MEGRGGVRGDWYKSCCINYVPALSKCDGGGKIGKIGVRGKVRDGEERNSSVECSALLSQPIAMTSVSYT